MSRLPYEPSGCGVSNLAQRAIHFHSTSKVHPAIYPTSITLTAPDYAVKKVDTFKIGTMYEIDIDSRESQIPSYLVEQGTLPMSPLRRQAYTFMVSEVLPVREEAHPSLAAATHIVSPSLYHLYFFSVGIEELVHLTYLLQDLQPQSEQQ